MDAQNIRKSKRTVDKPYATWSYEERITLLQTRIRFDCLFNGKNSNTSTGWRQVVEECKFGPEKGYLSCKQQWTALMKIYKSCFNINTGDGAGDEAPAAKINREDWPYFDIIHEYASQKDNHHPPYLLSNSRGVYRRPIDEQSEPTVETMQSSDTVTVTTFNLTSSTSRSDNAQNAVPRYSPTPFTSRGSGTFLNSSTSSTSGDNDTHNPTPSTSRGNGNTHKNLSEQEKYFRKRDRRLETRRS